VLINTAPTAKNQAMKPRPKTNVAGAKAGRVETTPAAQIAQRLDAAMARDRLHLDANLSLTKLARHVATPANLVSQTLNDHVGATFFDYVAKWRIEAAKPLIAAGEMSVLAVALEVGFNARSTFYKAFRRESGLTPQAYRRLQKAGPTPDARPSAS